MLLNSSVLTAVEYDPEALTLDVIFMSGKRYTYFGVPDWKYDQLITAKSAGQYFNENIRDQYAFEEH